MNNEIRKAVVNPDLPKISQVILIGDAPANTAEEVIMHRSEYCGGESYWPNRIGAPTSWENEVRIMRGLNEGNPFPIHCFYGINTYYYYYYS